MKMFINDIITFSHNGDDRITTDFLRKGVLIENLDKQEVLQGKGFRQIPRIYKLFHVVVNKILEKFALYTSADRIGIISAYEYANLDSNIDFEYEIMKYGASMVNPVKAPFTVCNSCVGWLAIRNKIQNLNLTVSSGRTSLISAMKIASDCIRSGSIDYCMILSANLDRACYGIIDQRNSSMKSEFVSAILMSQVPDLGRICEIQSVSVSSTVTDDISLFLKSISSNQEQLRIIFDGECESDMTDGRIQFINKKLSNRMQCCYLPIFLQDIKLSIQNNRVDCNYIVYDKGGSIGNLIIKC
jgi:hypothetical protein